MPRTGTKRTPESRWGNWTFIREEELLEHESGYCVDFKGMNTCAGMLDIIFQVETKQFPSADVGDLVTALADIFNPQANLCSDGREKPFDAVAELKQGFERLGRPQRTLADLT